MMSLSEHFPGKTVHCVALWLGIQEAVACFLKVGLV